MVALQKGSIAKLQLNAAEAQERGIEILAAMGPSSPLAIRDAPSNAWIPAEHMVCIMEAALEVGGPELAIAVAHTVTTSTTSHPFFRPLVNGTLRMFGGGPAPFFKLLPKAWDLVMRDAGAFTVEIGDKQLQVKLAELPPEMNSVGLKHSWLGTVGGLLELAGCEASTDLQILDDGLSIHVAWS